MKKIALISSLSILIVANAFGQTRFNFTTGLTVSSLTEDLMSDYGFDTFRSDYIALGGSATSDVTNSVKTGFYLAAESDIFLGESTFLRAGLKYATLGDSYFFKTDDIVLQSSSGTETDEKYKLRPRLDYFMIPVNLGVEASDNLSFYAGLTPSINVNNALRSNRFEIDGDDVKIKWDKVDNPVSERATIVFLDFGTSYSVDDSNSLRYVFDLRFNYSISTVYDDASVADSFNSSKIWSFELGMGVSL